MSYDKKTIWTTLALGQPLKAVIFTGIEELGTVNCEGTPENKALMQLALEKGHLERVRTFDGQELYLGNMPQRKLVQIHVGNLIIFNEDDVTVVSNPRSNDNFYFPFE